MEITYWNSSFLDSLTPNGRDAVKSVGAF